MYDQGSFKKSVLTVLFTGLRLSVVETGLDALFNSVPRKESTSKGLS